jgi:dolichyl-phosphate beta-glucosyltransferase
MPGMIAPLGAASKADKVQRVPPAEIDRLSFVIPAHAEEQRLGPTLRRLLDWSEGHLAGHEILVVDDGSPDGTAALVERDFAGRVRLLRHPRRRGKGAAVRTGVLAAREPWLVYLDADLPVPPEELPRFLAAAARAPLVIASKHVPGAAARYPWPRRVAGRLGQGLIRLAGVGGFHDTQCGFKLLRTDVAQDLFRRQRLDGFGFDFEVLWLARECGHEIVELAVPIEHKGDGSVSPGSYVAVLAELVRFVGNRMVGRYR